MVRLSCYVKKIPLILASTDEGKMIREWGSSIFVTNTHSSDAIDDKE
ncbi:hypothetical protein AF72_06465 [Xylella taiwanensis]|uniref:Uncharacterized protein n=1 Tax=Xylella taiwanensis TaxID=1444770 RepID=Z9JKK4_9GAMM|nr:hypothetical protein AF72_06465 [Xylella taiwanensis]